MSRQGGMNGPQATLYQEIEAWSRLMRVWLTPWEVECLRTLDIMSMNESAKDGKLEAEPPMTEDGELDRAAVASGMKNAFAGFKKDRG